LISIKLVILAISSEEEVQFLAFQISISKRISSLQMKNVRVLNFCLDLFNVNKKFFKSIFLQVFG